ncbi:response regulator [Thauera aromatica]|uniref:response regulator n=1 Tax=Thauera aromatica TaxID=59405 RepID=UPI001FFC7E10|nr:response regulator [Thauera aromatica]MCK2088876.1 response regulator [Thauera aromatica]
MTALIRDRFQIEWLLLIASLLVVGCALGWSNYREYDGIGRHEHDRLGVQARVIEHSVSRTLDVINRTLTNIRDNLPVWQLQQDRVDRANSRLAAFADAMRSVRTFLVLDASGKVIAASRPELLGQNFSERQYFQTPRAQPDPDRLYVSPPFRTVLGVWTMIVTRMVPGPDGSFAGVITATLDPEELRAELGAVLYEPDMWAALAHGDGLLLMTEPAVNELPGKNLAQPGSFFTRHMNSGLTAQVLEGTVLATGEYRLMALHTIWPAGLRMDKPLVAAISRDVGALYADWRQRAWYEAGLFGTFALLSLVWLQRSQRRRRWLQAQQGQADAALAESERFMRSLVDIIPGMVGYWDNDLRCRFANKSYLEWFGKSPEEMQGIEIAALMGEELFRQNEPFIRGALAGQPQEFERTLIKPDGSIGYTWAHYIPDVVGGHVVGGHVLGFFAHVADISAIKRIQQQLEVSNAELEKRSIEAEAASRAKSAFVANMSHEIRTPMNAVLGLLQLLELTRLDARQLDYVRKAQGAGQSLLGLLNDILDFSKVEAGKLELDVLPFRLDEMLRNLSVMLAGAVRSQAVEVLFQLDPGLPHALRGDGLRLQQVLLNLAGNAIKFTERGEVVVALKLLEETPEAVHIEFSVRDTGIGIAPDVLPRLFSAFEQADASTTRRFGGSGLGLAISRRLVQLMGGELAVESVPGQGSHFHFSVRFSRDAEAHAQESASTPPRQTAQPLRVLIADDNATAREVLAAMAESFGWQVTIVASGRQALEQLRAADDAGQPFDVLCVDWIMPDMDGWATLQQLRSSHPGRLPAILMVTAHGRELVEEQLVKHPQALDGLLVKPVTPSMLFDAVSQATGGEKSIPQSTGEQLAQTKQPLAGLRVLLVEDHPLNQQVARELLSRAGAEIEIASNGLQCIECVRAAARPFDAILMDIQMPTMDGYTATRILRTETGITTPIIAMTANAMPADREACIAAGMNDHVGKPIDIRVLIDCLLRHCRRTPVGHAPAEVRQPPALPEIPEDFDLAAALARVDGNPDLFVQLARRFGADGAAILANAMAAWQRSDHSTLAKEMHTLKGLAATLGAQALQQQAADIEAAIREAPDTDLLRQLTDLVVELASAAATLRTVADALAPEQKTAEGEMTPAQFRERLEALDALLAESNMRALDVFAAFKQEAGAAFAQSLAPLDDALQAFDFTTARKIIDGLEADLKS